MNRQDDRIGGVVMDPVSRRDFLVRSALVTAAGVVAGGAAQARGASIAASKALQRSVAGRPAPLAIARGRDIPRLVQTAVSKLGGARFLECRGQHVLLKPTLAWNRTPEQGANVHPEVLGKLIELLLDAGAKTITILDRTTVPSAVAYRASGAERVVRRLADDRVRIVGLQAGDFVPIPTERNSQLEDGDTELLSSFDLEGYRVCRHLLDSDRVVNVATARHHPRRQVALGMANLLGLVGGSLPDARWLHKWHVELAVVAAAVRPEVTVLDATRVVTRNGPAGLDARDVEWRGEIAVSRDAVAVEAHGATLFGLAARDLPWVALAEKLGLGKSELKGSRRVEVREP